MTAAGQVSLPPIRLLTPHLRYQVWGWNDCTTLPRPPAPPDMCLFWGMFSVPTPLVVSSPELRRRSLRPPPYVGSGDLRQGIGGMDSPDRVLLYHREAYARLLHIAQATRSLQQRTLETGLRLTIRVYENRTQLILARRGALVGLTEAGTMTGWCGVPVTAQRWLAARFASRNTVDGERIVWTWERIQPTLDAP